jgi:hypothetical protein
MIESDGGGIVVPVCKWTETHQFCADSIDVGYRNVLKETAGTVNDEPFRGRAAGCVRFDGVQGGESPENPAVHQYTFHFTAARNAKGVKASDFRKLGIGS